MALTDRQKLEIAIHFGLCRWVHPVDGEPYVFWHADRVTAAFEEVESAACAARDARIAELERQLAEASKDARRLDWMIFHTAQVVHTRDGEYCRVLWYEDDTSDLTAPFGTARDAIDNAMQKG